ncbi:hypothetical protein DXZ20_29085 [Leptolyngbyaceae cyanobacterium CCMR0081]|uniref:NfeD-like C-terminal domain-containing protein n=2 Tax=Adonisia turfae TaxID=2950184 RepID=A0A6M0RTX8_9CYAN|nr:hypothetical protein [Adonisia turfae CCMR0081]
MCCQLLSIDQARIMLSLTKEYRCDATPLSHREIVVLNLLIKVLLETWFKRLRQSHPSPTNSYLEGVGTADTEITPCKRGRVRLNGSWWSALSNSNMTIHPGQKVRVTSRQSHTLLVELSQDG